MRQGEILDWIITNVWICDYSAVIKGTCSLSFAKPFICSYKKTCQFQPCLEFASIKVLVCTKERTYVFMLVCVFAEMCVLFDLLKNAPSLTIAKMDLCNLKRLFVEKNNPQIQFTIFCVMLVSNIQSCTLNEVIVIFDVNSVFWIINWLIAGFEEFISFQVSVLQLSTLNAYVCILACGWTNC